ncbi:ataxin-10-like [Neltuma alba]|uniref:ataxin-10-like n=1 Tax=Neltuma alba TaxID=207710 RepID=UPI0010A58FB6|nr:ataxin-10-like [Prosopis alba]XP_028801162.1 ataxin-10-like [Prosopis alba]XP_028801165.1 ataxin-10-like [Prosopis alba]
MGDTDTLEYPISEQTLRLLFGASSSTDLEKSLEIFEEISKSASGRSELSSKGILPAVLEIIHSAPCTSQHHFLPLSLKLLRNLCAGEIANQNSFVELKGAGIVSNVLRSVASCSDPDQGLARVCLQVLANVSLAGKDHQHAIWEELYPNGFVSLARLRNRGTCDPLCMIIYTCYGGNPELVRKLYSDSGWPIMVEIIRTASLVGFGEDWLKLLLSRICLEESQLPLLFSKLWSGAASEGEVSEFRDDQLSSEQAFLLEIVAEILNERITDVAVTRDVALFVYEIFKHSIGVLEHAPKAKSGIPTGCAAIDVLGYSISIMRDICAQDDVKGGIKGESEDVVNELLSQGLIDLLLSLLHDLEPPAIIRKAIKQSEKRDKAEASRLRKPCLYKGFRRDIVALVGNCLYRRKHAQDEIRGKNGIILLLQQCVTDEDNPFLREWGIWSVRNMLEGNEENQRAVAELEVQGSVDVPEISALGLRVEIDQKTRRAKLVNVP